MSLHRDATIEAHKIRRTMRRLGDDWSWSRCMKYGWNKVKGRQALRRAIWSQQDPDDIFVGRQKVKFPLKSMVGGTGIEPVTPPV